jgi:RNA polymerase sigma-70 factor (ECF subfamily)
MSEIAAGAIILTGGSDSHDETHLIRRCCNQDTEAFRWLVLRYQARVYNFVRRMVSDVDDAEDVTQEVFVKAFKNIQRYDGRASLATWLFKIAANLCVDRARRRKRRGDSISLDESVAQATLVPADTRWNPEQLAVASEMRAAIEATVEGMSDKLKPVLLLHDMEGMDYQEIAETLGIPLGTVKSRLFLARGHLQAALAPFIGGGNE